MVLYAWPLLDWNINVGVPRAVDDREGDEIDAKEVGDGVEGAAEGGDEGCLGDT